MTKWRVVTALEALQFAEGRKATSEREMTYKEKRAEDMRLSEGQIVTFDDGAELRILFSEGFEWSEHTWESGFNIIQVRTVT